MAPPNTLMGRFQRYGFGDLAGDVGQFPSMGINAMDWLSGGAPQAPAAPTPGVKYNANGEVVSPVTGKGPLEMAAPAPHATNQAFTTKQMQQQLLKLGYRLQVDGIAGPITKSAWAAFQKGVPATAWNASYYGSSSGKGSGSTPSGNSQSSSPATKQGTNASSTSGSTAPGVNPWDQIKPINPVALAKAMTAQQYDAAIAEQRRQQAIGNAQNLANQKTMGGWYDKLNQMIGDQQQANPGMTAQFENQIADATKGIQGAFGGTANGPNDAIGNYGALLAAAFGAEGANNQAYLGNEKVATKQRGIDDLKVLQGQGQAASNDIGAKLIAAMKERGNAYTSNLSKAQTQQLQQLAQIQNMDQIAQNFPLDQQYKKAQISSINASNTRARAQAKAYLAKAHLSDPNKAFGNLTPDDRTKLANTLTSTVKSFSADLQGHKGQNHPLADPKNLYNRFVNNLSIINPAWSVSDPKVRAFLAHTMRALYPDTQRYPMPFLGGV